ncbi:54S ribosomal protein L23, mitochondrial [Thecaphora frezii]
MSQFVGNVRRPPTSSPHLLPPVLPPCTMPQAHLPSPLSSLLSTTLLSFLPPFSPLLQTSLAFARTWHHLSAKDQVLGSLAVNIARKLMGKDKPIYDQSIDVGDYVVVTNAKQVVVTGRKADQIMYRHHTMYPGGLKEIKYSTMMEKKPEEVSGSTTCSSPRAVRPQLLALLVPAVIDETDKLRLCSRTLGFAFVFPLTLHLPQIIIKAVSGMLPKNKLRDRRLERLKVFPGDENPYAQNITKRYDLGDAFDVLKQQPKVPKKQPKA